MPVLLILFGVILSLSVNLSEGIAIVVAGVLTVLWYIVVKILEKIGLFKGKYGSEIAEIIYVDKESEAE